MKTWCRHISCLKETVDGNRRYSWWLNLCQVKKNWKYCPICKSPRPTEKEMKRRNKMISEYGVY